MKVTYHTLEKEWKLLEENIGKIIKVIYFQAYNRYDEDKNNFYTVKGKLDEIVPYKGMFIISLENTYLSIFLPFFGLNAEEIKAVFNEKGEMIYNNVKLFIPYKNRGNAYELAMANLKIREKWGLGHDWLPEEELYEPGEIEIYEKFLAGKETSQEHIKKILKERKREEMQALNF